MKLRLVATFLMLLLYTPMLYADTDHGAVYRYVEIDAEVEDNRLKRIVRWKLDVLNRRGDEYADITLAASNFIELKKVSVSIYNSAGDRVEKHDRDDFIRMHGWDGISLYADAYTFFLNVGAPSYPYTVECEYEQEYRSLFFWSTVPIQRRAPIDSFSYRLEIDSALPFAVRVDGIELEHAVTYDGDTEKHRWHTSDVRPFVDGRAQSVRTFPGGLKFAAGRFDLGGYEFDGLNWDNVAAWYRRLAEDRYQPPLAAATVDLSIPARERLKAVYEEVVRSVRYVAFSIGISGWQPASASETRQCGYGDCKGMTTLLIANARAAGIEIWPALVLTRTAGQIDPQFPEFGFNHVVAMAVCEGDTVWMDPTCDDCAFGDVPYTDEGTTALLITDSAGIPLTIPHSGAEDNHVVGHTRIYLAEDGSLELSSRYEATGNPGHMLRSFQQYADNQQFQRFAGRLVDAGLWEITELQFIDSACGPSRSVFIVEGQSKRPARRVKDDIYVPVPVVGHGLVSRMVSLGMVSRASALDVGATIEETVELALKPGLSDRTIELTSLPDTTGASSGLQLTLSRKSPGVVSIHRVYQSHPEPGSPTIEAEYSPCDPYFVVR